MVSSSDFEEFEACKKKVKELEEQVKKMKKEDISLASTFCSLLTFTFEAAVIIIVTSYTFNYLF